MNSDSLEGLSVAHILPWRNIGGTEIQTLALARTARDLGIENHIFSPVDAPAIEKLFSSEGFPVHEYDQQQPSFTKPFPYVKASRQLASSLRKQSISIVHCADILGAHFAGLGGVLAGAKVISHVRNDYQTISGRDRTFLSPVKRFLFVSQKTGDNFAIKDASRGRVLYDLPAISYQPVPNARQILELPSGNFIFGMAARFAPQKDFETLIKAAQIVRQTDPACLFVIAGDYNQNEAAREIFQSVNSMLDQTGTRENFRFIGFQSSMSLFYSAIDAFVLSSHWEGLATVVLEAMLYKKPVVTADVGGVAEAIIDGRSGFLVPPKSPQLLAEKLLAVMHDPALRQRMANEASISLEEKFGLRRFREQVFDLYREMWKGTRS